MNDANLKRPQNVRHVIPHVCAMCNEFRYGDGSWECLRSDFGLTVAGDTGDGKQYETTCDRWRSYREGGQFHE